MGCHVLDEMFDGNSEAYGSIVELRDRFVEEARFQVKDPASFLKMTTIQTFAIMFLIELARGNGARGSLHLRLAIENLLLIQTPKQMSDSSTLPAWGILTLHT